MCTKYKTLTHILAMHTVVSASRIGLWAVKSFHDMNYAGASTTINMMRMERGFRAHCTDNTRQPIHNRRLCARLRRDRVISCVHYLTMSSDARHGVACCIRVICVYLPRVGGRCQCGQFGGLRFIHSGTAICVSCCSKASVYCEIRGSDRAIHST